MARPQTFTHRTGLEFGRSPASLGLQWTVELLTPCGVVAGPGPGGALHCTALMDRYKVGRMDWTLAALRVPRSWILKLRFGVRWSAVTPDEDVPGEFGFNYFKLRGGNYIGQ